MSGKVVKVETMPRIYKIIIGDDQNTSKQIFKADSVNSFEELNEAVILRYPELKDQLLEYSYKDAAGDKINIKITADLEIMARQSINTIFVMNKGHISSFYCLELEMEHAEYNKFMQEKMGLNF